LAYVGSTDKGEVVVVDGEASKPYRTFVSLALSPDGSRYAYEGDLSIYKPEIVIDGKVSPSSNLDATLEQTNYTSKQKQVFRFSPDSKHLAMASMVPGGAKYVISVDGNAGPTSGWCSRFVFSKDSSHFAYVTFQNPTTTVTLDQKVVQTMPLLDDGRTQPSNSNAFQFRDDGKLKYLALKDGKIFRVSVKPGGG
jgi:hypothetical protein